MSAAVPVVREKTSSDRGDRARTAVLLVSCAAADATAAAILLFATPLPPSLVGLAAAVLHGTAVLLLSGLACGRPSRRWLVVAAVVAVPFIGAAVAAATLVTRGRGTIRVERRRPARRRPALTTAAIRRLGGALSPCDALDGGDEEQRRAALWALSWRRDPEAIALLRRAAAGRDPDLALSAALAMDEIRERAERQAVAVDGRHGTG